MVLAGIAATLAGIIVGILALIIYWYFLGELTQGRFRQVQLGYIIALLFGSSIASAPIGKFIIGTPLWGWYVVGEALIFGPGSIFGAVWHIARIYRGKI